jgi:hypothetical protein
LLVELERLLERGAGVVRPAGEPMDPSEVLERVAVRVEENRSSLGTRRRQNNHDARNGPGNFVRGEPGSDYAEGATQVSFAAAQL